MMNVFSQFIYILQLIDFKFILFFFRLKVFGLSSSVPGETATIKKPSAKP